MVGVRMKMSRTRCDDYWLNASGGIWGYMMVSESKAMNKEAGYIL